MGGSREEGTLNSPGQPLIAPAFGLQPTQGCEQGGGEMHLSAALWFTFSWSKGKHGAPISPAIPVVKPQSPCRLNVTQPLLCMLVILLWLGLVSQAQGVSGITPGDSGPTRLVIQSETEGHGAAWTLE